MLLIIRYACLLAGKTRIATELGEPMRYVFILTIFTLSIFIHASDLPTGDAIVNYDPATLSIDKKFNDHMLFLFEKINDTKRLLLMFDWRNLAYIEKLIDDAKNNEKSVAVNWAKMVFLPYFFDKSAGILRLMPASEVNSRIYIANAH